MSFPFVFKQARQVSVNHVAGYYSQLMCDSIVRYGEMPDNHETLPAYIREYTQWHFYPQISSQIFHRLKFWSRGDLPKHHLHHYLTCEGKNRNMIAVAEKFLSLISDEKAHVTYQEIFHRKKNQNYIRNVLCFFELLKSGGTLPPLIATRSRHPLSNVLVIDGNTRGIAAACLYLEEKRIPSIGIYVGKNPVNIDYLIRKITSRQQEGGSSPGEQSKATTE